VSQTHEEGRVGPAVLDIGPGAGGLLIRASQDMRDQEIEVISVSQPERRTHVGVLERTNGNVSGWVAVFSGLQPDEYTVCGGVPPRTGNVTVRAAEVTELDWT